MDRSLPEESRPLLIAAIACAAGGAKDRFKGYCPTAKGSPRWWEVSTSPICDRDRRPARLLDRGP
ncbi:PAS domain-containing protein [Croceicoccus sp. BE223]|uniref:PAS domain-containing protein n=1 Tax=Croceicoccus sp. BE223 TaxID=2817716 RepID=UPI0038574F2F